MHILAEYYARFQAVLLPVVESCVQEALTERQKQFLRVLDILQVERFIVSRYEQRLGRRRKDRRCIFRAFVAKAVYNLPTTQLLIEMLRTQPVLRKLCGFELRSDVPSAATFSRAFDRFAQLKLGDTIHAGIVKAAVGDRIVMHVSRDATEVVARERPVKKVKKEKPVKKRGRPRADAPRQLAEPTGVVKQFDQTPEEALAELRNTCDVGAKADSKGNLHYWTGWKAHIDWADGGVPLNVVTTSASVHDSQVAIPMMRVTATRVTSLYDLMDAAYHSEWIEAASQELGHVAIIGVNKRGTKHKPVLLMDEARARRYNERTTAERGNSRLKDEFGFRHLRVRGHPKAHMHLMFGVLALFGDQILKLFNA
jgi:IS5 family transposase